MKKLLLIILIVCVGQIKGQYTKLLDFSSGTTGGLPIGTLISDGVFLYGMTDAGGAHNSGTIFKIMPDGTGYVKLLDFAGYPTDGGNPHGNLFYDGTFLYGMTGSGGIHNLGTIFKIMPDGSSYAKLLDFSASPDGNNPYGSLISDGTFLYGMTWGGGSTSSLGTVFKIMPDGSGYTKILTFTGIANGSLPLSSLIFDGTYLYGLTESGGVNGMGVIFKIKTDGSGYTKILDFDGVTTGRFPQGSLFTDGTFLYGMTTGGGSSSNCGSGPTSGCGTIFKIKPDGSAFLKLLDFDSLNGRYPAFTSLISDGAFLYGMTMEGGAYQRGVIFKILTNGTGYTILLDFDGATNGQSPEGSLFSDGNFLYGMTASGGANNNGTLFKFGGVLGVEKINTNTETTIYPNPTSDQFYIEANLTDKLNVDLYDVNGRHVFSATVNDKSNINVATLDNGTYSLTIKTADRVINKKLVMLR